MGPVNKIIKNLDHLNQIYGSSFHSTTSSAADRDVIIKEIREKGRVLECIPGRSHRSFPDFISNPLKSVKYKEFVKWLQECALNNNCTIKLSKITKINHLLLLNCFKCIKTFLTLTNSCTNITTVTLTFNTLIARKS